MIWIGINELVDDWWCALYNMKDFTSCGITEKENEEYLKDVSNEKLDEKVRLGINKYFNDCKINAIKKFKKEKCTWEDFCKDNSLYDFEN